MRRTNQYPYIIVPFMYPYPIALFKFVFDLKSDATAMQVETVEKVPGKLGEGIFTARKRSLQRLCFHRCLSVHREGVCPIACWDTPPEPEADTPWADTPPDRHPQADTPLCRHPPVQRMLGYSQQVRGMHPTGIHSCLTVKNPRASTSWAKFHKKYLESAWTNPGPIIWARCIARTFNTESQK